MVAPDGRAGLRADVPGPGDAGDPAGGRAVRRGPADRARARGWHCPVRLDPRLWQGTLGPRQACRRMRGAGADGSRARPGFRLVVPDLRARARVLHHARVRPLCARTGRLDHRRAGARHGGSSAHPARGPRDAADARGVDRAASLRDSRLTAFAARRLLAAAVRSARDPARDIRATHRGHHCANPGRPGAAWHATAAQHSARAGRTGCASACPPAREQAAAGRAAGCLASAGDGHAHRTWPAWTLWCGSGGHGASHSRRAGSPPAPVCEPYRFIPARRARRRDLSAAPAVAVLHWRVRWRIADRSGPRPGNRHIRLGSGRHQNPLGRRQAGRGRVRACRRGRCGRARLPMVG